MPDTDTELELKRRMLRTLYKRLMSYSFPPLYLSMEYIARLGVQLNLSEGEALQLFDDLVSAGYIEGLEDGSVYASGPNRNRIIGAWISNISTRGKRFIGLLPPERTVERVVKALKQTREEVRADRSIPYEVRQKQSLALYDLAEMIEKVAEMLPQGKLDELFTEAAKDEEP